MVGFFLGLIVGENGGVDFVSAILEGHPDGGEEFIATVKCLRYVEKATGVGAARLGHLHHTPRPSLVGGR